MITFEQWKDKHGGEARIAAAESGQDQEAGFDSERYLEKQYEKFQHTEALKDLISKTREQVDLMASKVPDMVRRLDIAGAGIVNDHLSAIEAGQPYREVNKVVLACLKEFQSNSTPPRSLNTKDFRHEVDNLYKLL